MVVYTLEQRWVILRHHFCRFWKKIIFSDEAHFDLGGYVNKQNCHILGPETPTHTMNTQNESLFGEDFSPEAYLRHFSSKLSKERPLQSMGIVIAPCWTNFWAGYWQHLVSTGRRFVPHRRSYTQCFAPCVWRSRYQPLSWCRLATSKLRFDTVGLVYEGCRQR